jgi:hypothetical protein
MDTAGADLYWARIAETANRHQLVAREFEMNLDVVNELVR